MVAFVNTFNIRKAPFIRPLAILVRLLVRYVKFIWCFRRFQRLQKSESPTLRSRWSDRLAILDEATKGTAFDRHYVYHCSWAARVLARLNPLVHVDIASSLFFVGIVSAFIKIRFLDYRPADLQLSDLETSSGDLFALNIPDDSLESVSCMHVVEHIGLGRYGDPLDPNGDAKAVAELRRVVRPGGSLLFVVPVGRSRVCFNAHRVYGYQQIIGMFDGFDLMEFALIPELAEDGHLIVNASEEQVLRESYGCGCFWFVKRTGSGRT